MNFYKRFIGDIQAKTGGLTLAQFGAYDRLLDHLFSTEKPIAQDEVYRICRAMGKDERAAVDKVLEKFFDLSPEGYTQAKALEEIERAQPLIEAARENGKKGGRPRKKQNPDETQRVPKNNPAETQQEPSSKASQSQSQSQTHSPSLRSGEVGAGALPGVPPELFADYMAVRRDKKAKTFTATAARGLIREAESAGMTLVQVLEACCEYGWIGFNPVWYAERQAKAGKRGGNGETAYQQSQRERVNEFAPAIAKRTTLEMEPFDVPSLASH